jgi:hypothetical protein
MGRVDPSKKKKKKFIIIIKIKIIYQQQALECNYASNKSQIFEPRRRQEYNQADGEDNNVSMCHMCMVLLM